MIVGSFNAYVNRFGAHSGRRGQVLGVSGLILGAGLFRWFGGAVAFYLVFSIAGRPMGRRYRPSRGCGTARPLAMIRIRGSHEVAYPLRKFCSGGMRHTASGGDYGDNQGELTCRSCGVSVVLRRMRVVDRSGARRKPSWMSLVLATRPLWPSTARSRRSLQLGSRRPASGARHHPPTRCCGKGDRRKIRRSTLHPRRWNTAVSIDAMGCNPNFAQSLLDARPIIFWQTKDNQPKPFRAIG